MLLAEELALLTIDPESGRPPLGMRSNYNATLAGLLLIETLVSDDIASSPLLSAAREIVDEKNGKPKAALSHMDRGLRQRLGVGTWDAVIGGLVAAGVLGPEEGSVRPKHDLLRPEVRDEIVERLRIAAANDDPLDVRTATVLSMTGPAHLLELVAPDRKQRKHARNRIDHALDATDLAHYGKDVRRVLADAQAAVTAATAAATAAAVAGSS